ncbi:MAG: TlpA family protein disulfide reductase, partial [Candidatus Thorarchaeota archaeon]
TATIISLTVDASETAQMMATYKSEKGLMWAHGLDTGEKFDNYFNVQYIPTIVLIDANGFFRYMHVGLWSAGSISDAVASIL